MKNYMASPPFLVFFTVLIFFSILDVSMLVKADQNTTISKFVHDTCSKTHELKKRCISEIDSDPHNELKTSLSGFLMIFVNHSISDFRSNILFLQKEINLGDGLGGDTKGMLEACLENFEIGVDELRETLEILQTKQGIDAEQLPVANVVNIIRGCVDDFEGVPVPPEWQSRYNASYALLDLSLSAINLITCNRDMACIPP